MSTRSKYSEPAQSVYTYIVSPYRCGRLFPLVSYDHSGLAFELLKKDISLKKIYHTNFERPLFLIVPLQMTVFRVLFNHWKEFITHRSKIPEGEDAREHFAEMLRRHRADTKSKKEASERRRLARLSAERKKKEKEEREKKRIEDLAR